MHADRQRSKPKTGAWVYAQYIHRDLKKEMFGHLGDEGCLDFFI